jgi:hypothetical protein
MSETAIQQVFEVLDAYIQKTTPTLTESSLYQIVKAIIPKLNNIKLNQTETDQLIEQVLKLFDPNVAAQKSPDQAAQEIAAQVADEVGQFQSEQARTLGTPDVTQPILGDLEVKSNIQKQP